MWIAVAEVESDSQPGVRYKISRDDGRLGCSCTAFRSAKATNTCKHIRAFENGNALYSLQLQSPTPDSFKVGSVAGETFTVHRAISFGAIGATPVTVARVSVRRDTAIELLELARRAESETSDGERARFRRCVDELREVLQCVE